MINEDINFKKLERYTNDNLKLKLYENKEISCCPHCNSKSFVKNGHYDGIQRYKCNDCRKTFSKTTKALWSYSKTSPEKWFKFMELTLEHKSLRYCAEKLEISLVTAFYWRHKIMHGLTLDLMPNKISGKVFISKSIIKENFKGCRKDKPNIKKNIWIAAAKGYSDSMIISEIGMDIWDKDRFNKNIYSKIKDASYIIAHNDKHMENIAKAHNNNSIIINKKNPVISNFRLNLRFWIRSFSGIATKYLNRYLHYFIIFNLYKIFDYINITFDLSLKNRFIKTQLIRECSNNH